jgi:predicted PurR-regulated permease PerM
MMGKGTNLGPVTVIVALAFWGMIWGMVGMILAVPVTAVFVIILSQIPSTRYLAIILSEKGDIPEIES